MAQERVEVSEICANGAIFHASKYGSSAQYARWIGDVTGLPVFDAARAQGDPADYEFLILVSAVLYMKLRIAKWVRRNLRAIDEKPILLVTVSGAPADQRLNGWIEKSLPHQMGLKIMHFALRGRQVSTSLNLFDRMLLKVDAMINGDPEIRKLELEGFDFVDRANIWPVVDQIEKLKTRYAR